MKILCLTLIALVVMVMPFVQTAEAGASISGTILPPGRVKSVRAFERMGATITEIQNRLVNGTIDPKTGKFDVPNLADGTYQLLLDCGDAAIEGVDLGIDDENDEAVADYVFRTKKLAVVRLDLSEFFDPDEAVSQAKKDDVSAKLMGLPKLIEKLDGLKEVDRFCEHLRPLCAHGTKKKALVLVETARLRDFYAGTGQAIYRVEIWPFERTGDVWDQPNKGIRVLQRHRLGKAEFDKLGAFFEPKLGGIRVLKGKDVSNVTYTVPDKWDDTMGKVPGARITK